MSIAVLQDKIRARKTPLALVLSPEADKLNPKITKNFTDLYGPGDMAEAEALRYHGSQLIGQAAPLLPAVVLRPNARTGNCPFFEADACPIHAARPLACALYPLGQAIDPATAAMEYYVQLPLCGARVPAQEQRTLQNYLDDAAITARAGIDARWAVVCTQLSDKLQQAGGRENPRYLPAARRIARALYFDYSIQDDFYPQFNANTQALWPLLDKML